MDTLTETAPSVTHQVSPQVSPKEAAQRIILPGISWATYESLLADLVDSHAAHFAYDEGALEIMARPLHTKRQTASCTILLVRSQLE